MSGGTRLSTWYQIAVLTLSRSPCSPLAIASSWKVGDAIIMKAVSFAETTVGTGCPVGVPVTAPRRTLLLGNLKVSRFPLTQNLAHLLLQDLAHLLLSIRMFRGTVSELKMIFYPLPPPASPTVCMWGPAKLVQIESKTVTLSYCLPNCSPWCLKFCLK